MDIGSTGEVGPAWTIMLEEAGHFSLLLFGCSHPRWDFGMCLIPPRFLFHCRYGEGCRLSLFFLFLFVDSCVFAGQLGVLDTRGCVYIAFPMLLRFYRYLSYGGGINLYNYRQKGEVSGDVEIGRQCTQICTATRSSPISPSLKEKAQNDRLRSALRPHHVLVAFPNTFTSYIVIGRGQVC